MWGEAGKGDVVVAKCPQKGSIGTGTLEVKGCRG